MAVDNSLTNRVFNKYEYTCDVLTIKCASNTYNIENIQIRSIYLERNYDNDHLPVFMIQIVMADAIYHDICTHPNDTVFNIKLTSQVSISESEKAAGSMYINGAFVPMGIDNTPYQSQQLYEDVQNASTAGKDSMLMNFSNARTFILCNKTQLNATKHISNYVLSSANMLNAVAVLLSQSRAVKPLVSPMDNNSSYSELILLPQPLVPQLRYLNSFFGFYREGAQIFFDFNYTYILRNTAKCTAYTPNEIQTVVFCIYDTSYGETAKVGSVIDLKTKTAYIGLSSISYQMDDLSNVANEYMGTNATIINNDGTVSNATSGKGTSYNVLSVTTHNKYLASELSLRMSELSCVVYLSLQNIDLNLLTPNKTFRIISTDTNITTKVNGLFRLVSTKSTFVKSGDYFSPTTVVELKRTDT